MTTVQYLKDLKKARLAEALWWLAYCLSSNSPYRTFKEGRERVEKLRKEVEE